MRYHLLIVACLAACASVARPEPAAAIALVYRELRQEAAEKSPDIAIARSTYRQKAAQSYSSLAHWLPRLDLQLSETNTLDYSLLQSGALPPGLVPPGLQPQAVTLGAWTLRATFPIYRRSTHLNLSQSHDEERVAKARLDQLDAELDWKLRSYVGNYLLQTYKVATIGASLAAAEANLRETNLRFDLGQRTRIDLLRAQAQVASLQSRRLQYDQQKASDRSALLQYTGIDDTGLARSGLSRLLADEDTIARVIDSFTAIEPLLNQLRPYLADDEAARGTTADRIASANALYHGILAEESLAQTQAEAVMGQEWPDLSLQGSLSKQGQHWGDLTNSENVSHSVALVLTVPLFIGGSLVSTAMEKHQLDTAAQLKRERDTIQLRNDVENERLQILALDRNVESLRLGEQQNHEIVTLGNKTFELGKETSFELLTSENEWIESKINLAKAKIDLCVLAYRLAANLGIAAP